jgi:hypothetical protein
MAFLMRTARSIDCQNAISDVFLLNGFLSVESLHHLEIQRNAPQPPPTALSRPNALRVLQLLATVYDSDTKAALGLGSGSKFTLVSKVREIKTTKITPE